MLPGPKIKKNKQKKLKVFNFYTAILKITSGSKRWLLKKLAPQKSWKTKNKPKTGQKNSDFNQNLHASRYIWNQNFDPVWGHGDLFLEVLWRIFVFRFFQNFLKIFKNLELSIRKILYYYPVGGSVSEITKLLSSNSTVPLNSRCCCWGY